MCASYEHELYMCLIYAMPSFQRCYPCIFVICVLSASSLLSRILAVADFSPCSAVIFMPCKLDATERSMLILRYFSKGVLNIWLWSIHSCPCLKLWSSVACHFLALFLLDIIPGRLLTWDSTLPWVLLVMHVPYELALTMLSFLNMSNSCCLPSYAM